MKRIFDIFVSLVAIVCLGPIMLIIVILSFVILGRGVIFKQVRPGKNAVPFNMIKFRTMKNAYDSEGKPLPDDQRMTRYGSFLRSSSLDELPGLWCVFNGDMSLVGPRPLLMEYVPLYSEKQARRHELRPGITGWAQVNGRNTISWNQKFELDVWYVDNQSFCLDIKILLLTARKVFVREGISAEGEVTMSRFTGTDE